MLISLDRFGSKWTARCAVLTLFCLMGCRPLRMPTKAELLAEATPGDVTTPVVVESDLARLRSTTWVARAPIGGQLTASPRWKDDAVDALVASTTLTSDQLAELIHNEDQVVATNAAIVLARRGDPRGLSTLTMAVRSENCPTKLRLAAAEAIGFVQHPSSADELRTLIDAMSVVRDHTAAEIAYLPDLHAELLVSLSRHAEAGVEPRFIPKSDRLASEAKLAALAAWSKPGPHALPPEIAAWRMDSDARVRAAALPVIATRRSPLALEAAKASMNDGEIDVRLAAIDALGRINSDDARKLLAPLARHSGEVLRAAALDALARQGDREAIAQASHDDSWRVRAIVANTLARQPEWIDDATIRELLADRSTEVQRQTIMAMSTWPTAKAGPHLLESLDRSSYTVRKLALEQLAQRWTPAREYSVDLPQDQAADALTKLTGLWRQEFGAPASAAVAQTQQPATGTLSVDKQRAVLEALTVLSDSGDAKQRQRATDQLVSVGLPLVDWLESQARQRQLLIPPAVYDDVLPSFADEFRALAALTAIDVQSRRLAANRLVVRANEKPLRLLVVDRLSAIMEHDNDPLIWQSALRAVRSSSEESAARMAIAGLSHPSDDVRRLACEHLAAHPTPAEAATLVTLVSDTNPIVAKSAIRALAAQGDAVSLEWFRPALQSTDRQVRLEAAIALAQRKDDAGPAAIERLAVDADVDTRRLAAQAMGTLRERHYIPTLMQLLDQGEGVGQMAQASLTQIVGDATAREVTAETISSTDRVTAWRKWWERSQSQ